MIAPDAVRGPCRFDEDPAAVRTARRLVAEALAEWSRSDLLDDAVLIASELVTNALAHGAAPVTIAVLCGERVTIEVTDGSSRLPMTGLPGCGGGFGMVLAGSLTDVTARTGPAGKTVRATLTRVAGAEAFPP